MEPEDLKQGQQYTHKYYPGRLFIYDCIGRYGSYNFKLVNSSGYLGVTREGLNLLSEHHSYPKWFLETELGKYINES